MTEEISNVNRRSFLKNAGVIIGGGALGAAGLT
ncbi:MAG: twin-arginine translocation signal domain-containing protein, partial [Desulfatiglans sp.]|nr:twin-arginine translocation signal domain-containing protein [Desulfatiglans sp.]NLD37687.1 twin-arginine translocation signal domain-containing protein [Desulfatiglans sp.]